MPAAAPAPPPPPPLRKPFSSTITPPAATGTGGPPPPFKVNVGDTPDASAIEFLDPAEQSPTTIPLKFVIRQYLATPHLKSVQAKSLHLILGRLRCLHHALQQYNAGVLSPTPAFLHYWRRRTLDLLSCFGFQIRNPQDPITIPGLAELIQSIEDLYDQDMQTVRRLIKDGSITFDGLGELFRPDTPVQGKTDGLGGAPAVFQVVDIFYEERRALLGMEKSFHFTLEFVVSLGGHFTVVRFTEVLSGWTGVRARPLSDLQYVPLSDPADLPPLKNRGASYAQFGIGDARFLAYAPGTFFLHSSTARGGLSRSGGSQLPTGGRVMVDPARGAELGHHASQGMDEPTQAMVQAAGRYRRWQNTQGKSGGGGSGSGSAQELLVLWERVPEEFVIYCWPALVGFSFSAKAWGHVLVAGLGGIEFRDKAFDQLVLAEERKQLIRALVRFGSGEGGQNPVDDIVGGKRGGSIFLLHGPPGVGKTLTAEAIAEVLHRPLYYVTMGELGMNPEDMERRLSDVLDLCAGWNALTLLDEADVFLEQRTTSDLLRNAMVCVMLRLLEYHPGILFLTTNRVRTFDPAFESRVTIALRYEPLVLEARVQIWRNLLGCVSHPLASDINYDELGKYVLNGRQIKNAVRLAVALAWERGGEVSQSTLETTLKITTLGRQEMKEDDSWTAT